MSSSATEESLTSTDAEAGDGEAGETPIVDEKAEETHRQMVFALCLLGANLVNAVALNLEA